MQSALNEPSSAIWEELKPLLDDAMEKIARKDHDALVLRFFENKNFADVGAALGASENAAKMRVGRALEKLRKLFAKRGVVSTTAVIAGAISANSMQAAPVGMAQTISTMAVAKGAAAGSSTVTLVKGVLKVMAWTTAKSAIVGGGIALLLASVAAVSIHAIPTKPGSFVKISGTGQLELFNSNSNTFRVVETANMAIWTDGKSYRISIALRSTSTNIILDVHNVYDMQAQYASDGTDTFELSDHTSRDGAGGFAGAGRYPTKRMHHIPSVVHAVWLAYCSSDYFNISSNQTGLKVSEDSDIIWPDYVTNLVAFRTNSTLPGSIIGWSRNLLLNPRRSLRESLVAHDLKQYPEGFKVWEFTTDDPVTVGDKQLPRRITLETFFPEWGDTITNGNDVLLLRRATFVADSITTVKGAFDPFPTVPVDDLQLVDSRFTDVAANFVINSHATRQGSADTRVWSFQTSGSPRRIGGDKASRLRPVGVGKDETAAKNRNVTLSAFR